MVTGTRWSPNGSRSRRRSGSASTSKPSNFTPHDESNSFVFAQELQPWR
jgi:hypothetical protein